MYHPTSRVLIVLEILQSRAFISGPELATRLEVDVRTVRHYITMLQDIGIPIETVLGRHGGYKLRPGFKLPPLMFNNDEALALTLGLMMAQKTGIAAMVTTAEGTMAKLERVLPAPLRQRVQALQETLVLGLAIPEACVESVVVETMSLAAQQARQVRICYCAHTEQETERTIDPYGIVCHDGKWYAVGHCHLRASVRIFRLDRIQHIELQAEEFIRPVDFQILDYMLESFSAIPDTWNVEVLLHISLEDAHRKVPASLATLTLEQHAQGVVLSASINSLEWMVRFLAGLGCPFTIRQPIELKGALQELAAELIQMAQ